MHERGENSHGSWTVDFHIHYGGRFEQLNGYWWYENGSLHKLEGVNGYDYMYKHLDYHVKTILGIEDIWMFFYRLPKTSSSDGLIGCQTELDMSEMFKACIGERIIDMYTVHDKQEKDGLEMASKESTLHMLSNKVNEAVDAGPPLNEPNEDLNQPRAQPTGQENDKEDGYDTYASSDCSEDAFAGKGNISDATDEEIEEARQKRLRFKKGKHIKEEPSDPLVVNDDHHIVESSVSEDIPAFMKEDKDSSDPDTEDSEEENECFEGEGGNDTEPRFKYKRYKKPTNPELTEFELGTEFATRQEFKDATTDYSLAQRKDIRFCRNEYRAISYTCWSSSGCPWRIWCNYKKDRKVYQVTKYKNKYRSGKNF